MSQWLQLLVLTVLGKLHRVLWHPPTQPSNTGRHPNCFLVHLCSKLCFCLAVLQAVSRSLVNPHQRCLYSDSPFARIDTFLYCRVQKWVGGSDLGLSKPQNHKKIIPNHFKKVHPKVQNLEIGFSDPPSTIFKGPASSLPDPFPLLAIFGRASGQIFQNSSFWRRRATFSLVLTSCVATAAEEVAGCCLPVLMASSWCST